jgi:hypothetical protein
MASSLSRVLGLAVVLVISATAVAGAEPAASPPRKNRNLALALGVAGTVVPFAMTIPSVDHPSTFTNDLAIAGAVMVVATPSAGMWYAGEYFSVGTGLRLAGGALVGASLYEASRDRCDNCGFVNPLVFLGALTGAAMIGTGAVLDILRSGGAADRWNARHNAFEVMPAPMRVGTGGYGFGATGRF